MNELVTVRNKLNGGVAKVRRSIAEHPIFGEHLEIVPAGTKPRVPLEKLVSGKRPKPKAPIQVPELDEDGK